MKTHQQLVGSAVGHPVFSDGASQRRNVARIVVVPVDKAKLRDQPGGCRPAVDRVKNTGRGGGRVLRVGRQNQNAAHALRLEHVELGRNGRGAITHGVEHLDLVAALAQPALQKFGLFFGPDFQRRAFRRPDAGVFGSGSGRACAQNNAVQYQQPQSPGDFNDPVIA